MPGQNPRYSKPAFQRERFCLNRRMVRDLYIAGQSTRQIAEVMGCFSSAVYKICKDIIRAKPIAGALRRPATSTHWRSTRQAARRKMERHVGHRLTSAEDVHHKDGDYTNGALPNLEILDHQVHARLDRKSVV